MLGLVVGALWAMLPAYVPNNAAVLAGGGRPIDGGRTLGGRRLLGDGKTWRGTAIGVLVGAALAVVLDLVVAAAEATSGLPLPRFGPAVSVALPAGAMAGDIAASFVKRRLGRPRGAAFPIIDQLDFVVVSLPLTALLAADCPATNGDAPAAPFSAPADALDDVSVAAARVLAELPPSMPPIVDMCFCDVHAPPLALPPPPPVTDVEVELYDQIDE
jgi:CDP-2,3-bis-(O-geranylgeranyl)-sn-glycerol synthase